MLDFQLEQLDHIAIRVKDIRASAKWYEEMLGLKPLRPKEWGEFPIIMLAGKSGIAYAGLYFYIFNKMSLQKNVKLVN